MKKYTIIIETEDGHDSMTRTNDGFNPIELLGIMEFIQLEVIEQMRGTIKPDVIKRQLIED